MDIFAAYPSRSPAMVDTMATVTSRPTFFTGARTNAVHEQFSAQTPAGPIQVIDNVDLAPRVAVAPGDSIEVCGEMVHDPGRNPVVHWTHHDPAHRHPDGFIRFRGRVYA
jgi:Protein of unknown function (DUF3465)